ncbi:MAG: hypothetical protein KME29_22005 [Calothrix sp. FI2-JRJ7]|nr:hypothetical protein [Calothrix sp. FI2-JRJ7]
MKIQLTNKSLSGKGESGKGKAKNIQLVTLSAPLNLLLIFFMVQDIAWNFAKL